MGLAGRRQRYLRAGGGGRSSHLAPSRLFSPASLNSDVLFQTGWLGAFAMAIAVRMMTRSC